VGTHVLRQTHELNSNKNVGTHVLSLPHELLLVSCSEGQRNSWERRYGVDLISSIPTLNIADRRCVGMLNHWIVIARCVLSEGESRRLMRRELWKWRRLSREADVGQSCWSCASEREKNTCCFYLHIIIMVPLQTYLS
jgi:hypothetical protein